MKMEEIKAIAKQHDIKPGKLKKGELVRAIQEAEANTPCFDTAQASSCDQQSCLWREDCA